jgi:hypothetical protein
MRNARLCIVVTLSALCAGCTGTPQSSSLQAELFKNYNMSLLRPPSTIYIPGTLAKVTVLDSGKNSTGQVVSLSRFCTPGAALTLANIPKSPTNNLTVSYNISGDVSAKAEVQKLVNIGGGLSGVDRIDITLINPVIYRPDDVQLRGAEDAIKQFGCPVAGKSLVSAVLQADVTVKTVVSSSANLSLEQTKLLQSIVGASFGATASSADNETMVGQGLFYGIEVASR